MLEVEGKTDRKIKGYDVALERLTGKKESTLSGGSKGKDRVVLGELGEAIIGGRVGDGESTAS